MTYLLDGRKVATFSIPAMPKLFTVLNLAVGVWFKNEAPSSATPTNPKLQIDWVGVW